MGGGGGGGGVLAIKCYLQWAVWLSSSTITHQTEEQTLSKLIFKGERFFSYIYKSFTDII